MISHLLKNKKVNVFTCALLLCASFTNNCLTREKNRKKPFQTTLIHDLEKIGCCIVIGYLAGNALHHSRNGTTEDINEILAPNLIDLFAGAAPAVCAYGGGLISLLIADESFQRVSPLKLFGTMYNTCIDGLHGVKTQLSYLQKEQSL